MVCGFYYQVHIDTSSFMLRLEFLIITSPFLPFQAIGEGGQGWANALLFIVFNAKTRKLIIASSLRMCLNRLPCFRCCFSCKCCVDMMYKQRRNALLEKLAQEEGGDNRSLLSDDSSIDGDEDYSASLREVSRDSTPSRLTVQYAD